jgi:hypothetical protein
VSLEDLRKQLELVNTSIFKLIDHRRQLVSQIQAFKNSSKHLDIEREFAYFSQLNLSEFSFNQLFIFSLMIEEHAIAGVEGSYPRWSQKEHLGSATNDLCEQVNPVLLYFWDSQLFKRLDFTEEYQSLFNNVLNQD